MNLSFRRDDEIQNCTVKDQRPSVSGQITPPSETSSEQTKEPALSEAERGSINEPEEKNTPGTPEPAC